MLLLNQAQLNMVRTQSQKRLQRNQSAEVRPRLRAWLHPAAQTGVKHPLRYLQRGQVLLFFSHATKDLCSAPPCFTADIYPLPIPWMPPILHLSDEGFMGVLYPSCTIEVARTRASDREFLITDRHLSTGRIVTVLKTPNESFQRLYWAAFTMNMSSNEQPLSCQTSFLRTTTR